MRAIRQAQALVRTTNIGMKRSNVVGFTLIESLVLLAIIGILASLLVPMLTKARSSARRAGCASRLKQWGLAFQMYSQDYQGWLFTTKHWESTEFNDHGKKVSNVYARYLGKATSDTIIQMRNCPNAIEGMSVTQLKAENRYGYSMNWPNLKFSDGYKLAPEDAYGGASYRLDKIPRPAEFLLLVDSDGTYYRVRSGELKGFVSPILDRHVSGVNILRADQHVDFVTFEEIERQSALPDDQNTWFQAN